MYGTLDKCYTIDTIFPFQGEYIVSLVIQRVLLGLQQGELYPWALLAHYYYYYYHIGGEGRCLSSALVLRDTLTPCRAARKHTIVGKAHVKI